MSGPELATAMFVVLLVLIGLRMPIAVAQSHASTVS